MKFLMCSPEHYSISYEINPWMSVKNQSNKNKSVKQWQNLVDLIKELGGEIELMSGVDSLPDIVFTANAGIIIDKKVIISKFKYPERQPEKQHYKNWFLENNFEVEETELNFEGAGDTLFCDKTWYCGFGFRTDKDFYYEKFPCLGSIYFLRLIDPYFYHLDTCFCPLTGNDALIFPEAFDPIYYKGLSNNLNLIEIPREEAAKFACNAICLGENVIVSADCPKTEELLKNNGYNPYALNLSEFNLAGGSAKCLTLRLD